MGQTGWYVIDRSVYHRYPDGGRALQGYRGVDGLAFGFDRDDDPLDDAVQGGVVDVHNREDVELAIAQRRFGSAPVDLLLIGAASERARAADELLVLGIDVGFGSFSCIVHEILYGKVEALRAFAPSLNANLLFDEVQLAERFLEQRRRCLADGSDLETAAPAGLIPISAPARSVVAARRSSDA
jgi:hypothetical protein